MTEQTCVAAPSLGTLSRPTAAALRAVQRAPVCGIRWAELAARPEAVPVCRGTPAAKAGLRFEHAVGLALRKLAPSFATPSPRVRSGAWLRYEDANGRGWAQPDHFVLLDDRLLLLECKLSQTLDAWHQLEAIYAPLLRWIFGRPVVTIGVFRFLVSAPELPLPSLRAATCGAVADVVGRRFTLHVHDPKRLS